MKFILLTFFFHLSYFSYSNDKIKALIGGTLIDGFGSIPIKNSVIIIEGEKIKEVGSVGAIEIPSNAEIISTEGMSVLPGLWDMHVHLDINGLTNAI